MNNVYDLKYYNRGIKLADFLINIDLFFFKKNIVNNDLVLEVGCGDGKICNWLSNQGFDIDAVDVSKDAIVLAKLQNSKVNFVVGDVFDLKSSNNKYDVVYSFHVMEHIINIDDTLREVRRILIVGGKLIVRIPNSDSFEAKIAGKKWFHWDEPYHVNHWRYGEFKNILLKNGFIDIKVNFRLLEYKQVLLYSILSYWGINMNNFKLRLLVLPLQIIFVPLSIILGYFFNNSGTVEIVARKS